MFYVLGIIFYSFRVTFWLSGNQRSGLVKCSSNWLKIVLVWWLRFKHNFRAVGFYKDSGLSTRLDYIESTRLQLIVMCVFILKWVRCFLLSCGNVNLFEHKSIKEKKFFLSIQSRRPLISLRLLFLFLFHQILRWYKIYRVSQLRKIRQTHLGKKDNTRRKG